MDQPLFECHGSTSPNQSHLVSQWFCLSLRFSFRTQHVIYLKTPKQMANLPAGVCVPWAISALGPVHPCLPVSPRPPHPTGANCRCAGRDNRLGEGRELGNSIKNSQQWTHSTGRWEKANLWLNMSLVSAWVDTSNFSVGVHYLVSGWLETGYSHCLDPHWPLTALSRKQTQTASLSEWDQSETHCSGAYMRNNSVQILIVQGAYIRCKSEQI